MSRLIDKEIIENRMKFEMYMQRVKEIESNPDFDIYESGLYDPMAIHVSEKDKMYHEYYVNNLLMDKYSTLTESLANELKRLKKYNRKK